MKKAVLLICLFISICSFSQEKEYDEEYLALYNHIPKGIENDETIKPLSEKLNISLNTFGQIRNSYEYNGYFQLNANDKALLKYQTEQLAVAFFLEKKYIMFEYVGGLDAHPYEWFELKKIENNEVIVFRFFHSCTSRSKNVEEFISIFNNRMKKLLKLS